MKRITTILIAVLLPIGINGMAQWPMPTPSRNMHPPPQQQQPYSNNQPQQTGNYQMYPYSPSIPPPPMSPQQQQPGYQWNNNNSQQPQNFNQQLQQQRQEQMQKSRQKVPAQRVLVDYPFTVEYVDRSNPRPFGNLGMNEDRDRKLIDYPFTVEYVNGMNVNRNLNPSSDNNRGQAASRSNPDPPSFQSNSLPQKQPQQQRQQQQQQPQQNYQRFSNNNQNTPVKPNNRQVAPGGYSGSSVCRLIKCAGGY